jgi:capsular polysaccharide transport system permease protein
VAGALTSACKPAPLAASMPLAEQSRTAARQAGSARIPAFADTVRTGAAPRASSMSSSIRSPFRVQRDVVYALLLREMGSRFGRSRVGMLWTLLEPIAHLVFPIVLFGFIMARALPGVEYPVFLVYGFLPFVLFRTVCMQTMDGTATSRGLLSYRQVLLMDVFVAKVISNFVIEAVVFGVIVAGLLVLEFDVLPPRPIEFAGVLLLTAAMAFGLGLLFAAISSVMPDARTVIKVLFIPLYFISGVLFPVSRFPDEWVDWLALNPVLHLVEMTRLMAVSHYEPMKQLSVIYPVAVAMISLCIGLALYRLRYLSRVTT